MSLFFAYLNEIQSAQNKDQREAAVNAALDEISDLSGAEDWNQFAAYGDWVNDIPQLIWNDQAQARKHIKAIVKLTARKNKIVTEDTAEKLIQKIKRCKTVEDLKTLEAGELSYHPEHEAEDGEKSVYCLNIPLPFRIERLQQQDDVRNVLAQQRKYLAAKRLADKVAWPLTVIFCLLSVGVISAIAMFVAFPLIAAFPVLGVIGLVAGAALIGYVDIAVFYPYIKRSLRNIFARGVFQSIDNNLLKKLAEEEGLRDRHVYSEEEQRTKLNSGATWWWRRLKYALTSFGALLTLAATVGFAGLAYAQIIEVLPMIGITAGFGLAVIPWVFAILAVPYFYLLFDNIFQAIKNNIFKEIWDQIKKVFKMEQWGEANWLGVDGRAVHLLKCLGKAIFVAAVFGVVVIATIFSAGATLQGCVSFFSAAFGMANKAAEIIGIVIGSIQLITNLGFNVENCFKTVGRFLDILNGAGSQLTAFARDAAARVDAQAQTSLPKAIALAAWLFFFRPIIKYAPLLLHITGLGMLAAQGLDTFAAKIFGKLDEAISRIIVAISQAISEFLEDIHTLLHDHSHDCSAEAHHHGEHHAEHRAAHEGHDHHEEKKKRHDKHEHADPAGDLEWVADKAVTVVKRGVSFFCGAEQADEIPEPDQVVSISIRL